MPIKGWVPVAIRKKYLKDACENCGMKSPLDLHHQDGDRKNNSPENLRTLCDACHTKEHWATGKKAWRRHGATCIVCGKPAKRLGLCETHRSRFLRHGNPYLKKKKIGRTWRLVMESGGQSGPESQGLSLQGYPEGWTALKDSEMPLSRKSRNGSAGSSNKFRSNPNASKSKKKG